MDNGICMGCGQIIDTCLAKDQEGLCLTCYGIAHFHGELGVDRETRFLERSFVMPQYPTDMDGKLDQLIEMTHSLQKELETIHTALKRYEAHHREKHHGS